MTRKKLIEVALPLDAINAASAREKSIRHGHPSTLHLWWSRKPLATCRAVLFASLVDDPSEHPEEFPTEQEQERERQRLFRLIEELVKWENSNNESVLQKARSEILKSTGGNPPPVLDPFAGGGSIPLEAQRLGLEAHVSDLNPVAVLINKALIEIPPRFAGRAPVNPQARRSLMGGIWNGARGLADDIRYYGKWMRDEAEKRIGHLYPKVTLPKEYGGGEATVIAWLWTRTVTCPNPACGAQMPLTSKWWLSKKKGKEAWVEPRVDRTATPPVVHFDVVTGKGKPQDGTVNRQGARCIACGTPVPFDHIRSEGKAGRMASQLMAIVAEAQRGRVYLAPSEEHIKIAAQARPVNVPESDLPQQALGFRVQLYGMTKHRDLFTPRQLVALTTFSDLVKEAQVLVLEHCGGDTAYSDAVAVYLTLGIDKAADRNSALCGWESGMERMRNTFTRQALSMIWDYAETNPFANAGGDLQGTIQSLCEVLDKLQVGRIGSVQQLDATMITDGNLQPLISTDPPYYDNIGYSDLSDFFYVWLRRSLHGIYPDLFKTMMVPKTQELIAAPYRFGDDKQKAERFFENGLEQAFKQMRKAQNAYYPLTVYYAFKQAESEDDNDGYQENNEGSKATASTGWETMLEGLIQSRF
jgi:putative DNA methylase